MANEIWIPDQNTGWRRPDAADEEPPTEPQSNYIRLLMAHVERLVRQGHLASDDLFKMEDEQAKCKTKRQASRLIDDLKKLLAYT